MSGFIIDLAALRAGLSRVEARAEPSDLGLPPNQWRGLVEGVLQVDKSGDKVSVRGQIRAVARLECVRCLKEFDCGLQPDVLVYAERSGHGRGFEKELERDQTMLFHDGRQLDLREEARAALLLELPMAPCCTSECRGLCTRCGADLNAGRCECPEAA